MGVQLPIIDLRRLVHGYPKLSAPSWPAPSAGYEFLRGVGVARDRPRGAPISTFGEKTYVNALGRLLKPVVVDGKFQRPPQTVYARIFGTDIGYRLDIGSTVTSHAPQLAGSIARRILETQYLLGKNGKYPLHSYAQPLGEKLMQQTTPHGAVWSGETRLPVNEVTTSKRRLIRAGCPLVLIEKWMQDVEIGLAVEAVNIGGKRIPVWELTLDTERRELSRNLRATVWRLHFEHEVLETVLNWLKQANQSEIVMERVLGYLDAATRMLVRESFGGYDQPSLLAVAYRVQGFDASSFSERLQYLGDEARGISRRLDLMIERTASRAAGLWRTEVSVFVNPKKVTLMGDRIKAKNSTIVNRSKNVTTAQESSVLSSPQFLSELDKALSHSEIQSHPLARETADALRAEVAGSKRIEIAQRLWSKLKEVSPVISTLLAAASLVNSVLGG